MDDSRQQTQSVQRRSSAARLAAGAAVLVALVALGIAFYGIVRQSAHAMIEIQLPYLLAAGGGAAIAATVAYFRSMSVWDIVEAALSAIAVLFALAGAILKGIGNFILGLFGLD